MRQACMLALAATWPLCAQSIDYSFLDKLAERAKESAIVNLGPEQLAMLAGLKPKEGKTGLEDLAKNLKGIQVRSYEFEAPGLYDLEQVRGFRDRVKADGAWVSLISVKRKEGFTEIMVKKGPDGKTAGLLIVAAEPKELSVVHIDGALDLSALGQLRGIPGIPEISSGPKKSGAAPGASAEPKSKKEE